MSSPLSSTASSEQSTKTMWETMAPWAVPPLAAAGAIVPAYRDMALKSPKQLGLEVPSMSFFEGVKGGLRAAPKVGLIVGTQTGLQPLVEELLVSKGEKSTVLTTLASSAIVGFGSSPFIAIFNGQTIGWNWKKSLRQIRPKQLLAITFQETGFVGGLSIAEKLAVPMRKKVTGKKAKKAVDYLAAGVSGAMGALFGHAGNTALTRWQKGLSIERPSQLIWGAGFRTRGAGTLGVAYKIAKDLLSPPVKDPE